VIKIYLEADASYQEKEKDEQEKGHEGYPQGIIDNQYHPHDEKGG
jgi:hypothetical protein